jgi:hypothetical protein
MLHLVGAPELMKLTVLLIVFGAPILFARTARSLGPYSYRRISERRHT